MKINTEKLIELHNSGFSNVKIGKQLNCHDTTVGRILKKLNLHKPKEKIIHTNCVICDSIINNNFKNRSTCSACAVRVRRYKFKVKAIDYLGGACVKCGYNKSISALQFHHINPHEKQFTISGSSNKSWEVLKKELDKCVLLCGNCHSEEHNRYSDEKLLNYIKEH